MQPSSALFASVMTLAAASCVMAVPACAQRDHVYNPDYIVTAYELTPAQEAVFIPTDGRPSPFWRTWDASCDLSKARINGVNNYLWGDSADGAADGGMELRVAYGEAGIYILFLVHDDSWAGYISPVDYANDAIEFFGSKLPASVLYGDNKAVNLPCLNGGPQGLDGFPQQLTYDYFQLGIRFGGLEPVQTLSYNYWSPYMMDVSAYGCWPGSVVTYTHSPTLEQMAVQYGIMTEILPATAQRRCQEWLIPWRSWGNPNGVPLTRRQPGESVAMCFGYNDLDYGGQTVPTAMRWRSADPYSNTNEEEVAGLTTDHTSYDAWGDIFFGGRLPNCPSTEVANRELTRLPDASAQIRWSGAALLVESGDVAPGDRVQVMDARGKIVLSRGASSSTIPWPTGLRGVFSVRVGERSVGTFVAR